MPESANPYALVNTIIKDSGYTLKDLRPGQYDAMVQHVERGGNIDIKLPRGADGKADLVLGGNKIATESPNSCPNWVPANLCQAYKGVTSIYDDVKKGNLATASDSLLDAIPDPIAKVASMQIRISMIVLGIILIAIGVIFALIIPGVEKGAEVVKPVAKLAKYVI